ncbi:hypothetical protein [Cyanobacterium sp. uoEpiScrs1]|uniref:hypothetical protein n=1 Tax=Cyanobacterium sp. uoEpiScrs1 TaxID=2976343 RepID=UPI00226A5557|nr:hypothetical protein [Cyanobacterium sp. uoEpiScrs1]
MTEPIQVPNTSIQLIDNCLQIFSGISKYQSKLWLNGVPLSQLSGIIKRQLRLTTQNAYAFFLR